MSSLDANRFPERMYPGEFDSIGLTSHAIWHVFVCFGIFVSESSFSLSLLTLFFIVSLFGHLTILF